MIIFAINPPQKKQFSNRPALWAAIRNFSSYTLDIIGKLDAMLPDGIALAEAQWIVPTLSGGYNAPDMKADAAIADLARIIQHMRSKGVGPYDSLGKVTSWKDARASMWRDNEYQRRLNEIAEKNRPNDSVAYAFPDGWNVVRLSARGAEIDEDLIGDKLDGYGNAVFSVRDAKGVPFAIISADLSDDDDTYLGVYQVRTPYWSNVGQITTGDKYIERWMEYLRVEGMRPIWVANVIDEKGEVKNLEDVYNNAHGAAPLLQGIGGDVDTYAENIEEAYSEASEGRGYYSSAAQKLIDKLVAYAYDRGEEKMLEQALERFGDKASDWFTDYADQSNMEHPYPTEDDFTTTVLPDTIPGQQEFKSKKFKGTPKEVFDKEGYERAYEAYEKEQEEMAKYFEPYEFLNAFRAEIKGESFRRRGVATQRKLKRKRMELDRAVERSLSEMKGEMPIEPDVEMFA